MKLEGTNHIENKDSLNRVFVGTSISHNKNSYEVTKVPDEDNDRYKIKNTEGSEFLYTAEKLRQEIASGKAVIVNTEKIQNTSEDKLIKIIADEAKKEPQKPEPKPSLEEKKENYFEKVNNVTSLLELSSLIKKIPLDNIDISDARLSLQKLDFIAKKIILQKIKNKLEYEKIDFNQIKKLLEKLPQDYGIKEKAIKMINELGTSVYVEKWQIINNDGSISSIELKEPEPSPEETKKKPSIDIIFDFDIKDIPGAPVVINKPENLPPAVEAEEEFIKSEPELSPEEKITQKIAEEKDIPIILGTLILLNTDDEKIKTAIVRIKEIIDEIDKFKTQYQKQTEPMGIHTEIENKLKDLPRYLTRSFGIREVIRALVLAKIEEIKNTPKIETSKPKPEELKERKVYNMESTQTIRNLKERLREIDKKTQERLLERKENAAREANIAIAQLVTEKKEIQNQIDELSTEIEDYGRKLLVLNKNEEVSVGKIAIFALRFVLTLGIYDRRIAKKEQEAIKKQDELKLKEKNLESKIATEKVKIDDLEEFRREINKGKKAQESKT